jgi:hypothetical protein
MTIEQRLAEIIRAYCADALSSTVNLNVDLDIMLCVLAQSLLAAFRARLGSSYTNATPDTLQRRFLDNSGTISITGDQTSVRIDRRACAPVVRQNSGNSSLPPSSDWTVWERQTVDRLCKWSRRSWCGDASFEVDREHLQCFLPA